MRDTLIHSARLVTAANGYDVIDRPDAWIHLRDGRIAATGSGSMWRDRIGPQVDVLDAAAAVGENALLTSGLIDIHCHGGGGASFDGSLVEIERAVDLHRHLGVTGIVLSLVSAPLEELEARLARIRQAMVTVPGVLGAHIEGPFIAVGRRGAHDPNALRLPSDEHLRRLLSLGVVRQVTLAPELPGGMRAVEQVVREGAIAAIGHTEADSTVVAEAFERGATLLTHAFNAMHGLHHRSPGPVGAAIADGRVTLEVIPDGVHVDGQVIRILFAAAPGRIAIVSDAMAAAGAPDGEYLLGDVAVVVANGAVKVEGSDSLAGSTLTLDEGMRRCVAFGVPLPDAVFAATAAPARAIGRRDLGSLTPGMPADVVLWDDDLVVSHVWQGGALIVTE